MKKRIGKKREFETSKLSIIMDDPRWPMPDYALVQFIADWNWRIADREGMVAEEPNCDHRRKAKIASVVHALCVKSGVETPSWALDVWLPEPYILFLGEHDTNDDYERLIIAEAPDVCWEHNVFFDADLLEKGNSEWEKQKFASVVAQLTEQRAVYEAALAAEKSAMR